MAAPSRQTRLLVVAPHPDDEAVCCGGLIALATRAGAQVEVVFLTNGDAFRVAAERVFDEAKVSPHDFLELAEIRQGESVASLARLGVPERGVAFLGYPDRGLAPMWLSKWEPGKPYLSPYTRCDHVVYRRALRPGARYCARSLLEDLEAVIARFQPTVVVCPHPGDTHGDHGASYCYTAAALYELHMLGRVGLFLYLAHSPGKLLDPTLPPPNLDGPKTEWGWLALDPGSAERKRRAIQEHRTQVQIMGRFLLSFGRERELYGQVAASALPHLQMRRAGEEAWGACPPAVVDVANDTAEGKPSAGDLLALYAGRDPERLLVRVKLAGPAAPEIQYEVHVAALLERKAGPPRSYVLQLNQPTVGFSFRVLGKEIEMALPWPDAGRVDGLMIGAETRLEGKLLDRTAWVVLKAHGRPAQQ